MSKSDQDFKKLMKGLQKFPANIQKNVMNGAIRAGAAYVRDEAKKRVPVRSGTLKRSLTVRKVRVRDKNLVKYKVVLTHGKGAKNDAYYGSMVEFGTSKLPAQPFMRPAAQQSAPKVVEASRKYLAARYAKEVLKMKHG